MHKSLFTIFLCLFGMQVYAQTGIGTSSPDQSAKLEVYANNKGFLPPRVSLTSTTDASTISNPQTGLLVYCKGDAGLSAGYYFWNGALWATIATAGGSGSVAAEYGSEWMGASQIAVTSGTPVTVVTFTLPSAGTWEVIYFTRSQGAAGYAGESALFDPSGVLVPNSEILSAYGELASTGTGLARVTTTGAGTYTLKAWSSVGSYNAFSDFNGRTGVTWKKISGNTPMTVINYGDIKTGIQSADHSGWVKLNGRAKSTLSASQQTQATALGIGTNLPDATNAFLVQNSTTLGSVSGSSAKTIARANLPNVSLTATTSNAGSHSHSVNVNDASVLYVYNLGVTAMKEGSSNWTAGAAANYANVLTANGDHNHSVTTTSMNGGVTQTTLDVTPKSLSVNTFIYLGY
ncbi:MAG: hypothetical protein AABZ56_01040 [Bacteroidota bacterium]